MITKNYLFDTPNEFVDFFQNASSNLMSNCSCSTIDIQQKDKNFIFYIPVVGFKKEDLEINFDEDVLSIKGKTSDENLPKFLQNKEIDLEYKIKKDIEDVTAKIENGLLIVELITKKSKDALSKKVKID